MFVCCFIWCYTFTVSGFVCWLVLLDLGCVVGLRDLIVFIELVYNFVVYY